MFFIYIAMIHPSWLVDVEIVSAGKDVPIGSLRKRALDFPAGALYQYRQAMARVCSTYFSIGSAEYTTPIKKALFPAGWLLP